MLKLIIEDDEGRKTVVPFVRDEITIGRQEGNTIRLTERNVSRRHARLLRSAGAVKIEDLGSSNGIRVNGDRISGLVQIVDGDLIQIGDYDLAIQREEDQRLAASNGGGHSAANTPMQVPAVRMSSSAGQTTRMPSLERETAPTVPALPAVEPLPPEADDDGLRPLADDGPDESGSAPRNQSTAVIRVDQVQNNRREVIELDSTQAPRLVVMNTEFAGREFLISKTESRIGRVDDNDVFLDHRSLSRTHCKLVREDNGEWRVIDMQSANGLMVNGEPYAQVTLRSGDVLELGHVKMKFVGPGEAGELPTDEARARSPAYDSADLDPLPPSRTPYIAVIVTFLVLVLGGGGYAMFIRRTPAPAPPVEQQVATKPNAVTAPPAPVEPPAEDATEVALAAAGKSLEAGDLDGAEKVLKECTINGAPCPGTTELLSTISSERTFGSVLDEAKAALGKQDAATARTKLDGAKGTRAFPARLGELEAEYAKLAAKPLAAVVAPKPGPPVVNPVVKTPVKPPLAAAATTAEQTEKMLTDARAMMKAGSFESAIEKLKQCLALESKNLGCIRLVGSSYGRINSGNEQKKYYELYLRVAPADDAYVPKIKEILANSDK